MARGAFDFGSYNPQQVDQARTQNRLAQMQMRQAESELDRQNRIREILSGASGGSAGGQSGGSQQSNRLRNAVLDAAGGPTKQASAMMDRAGGRVGSYTGPGATYTPAQVERLTDYEGSGETVPYEGPGARISPSTEREIASAGRSRGGQGAGGLTQRQMTELMALDPQLAGKIQEQRQAMREEQREQEDREAVVFANMLDQVEKLPPDQRQAGYERMRQYAQNRLGMDVSDMPAEYDPTQAGMVRAWAASTGEYEPPEAQGGDMPSAVREAMFITGGDEEAARAYLREQNRDRSGNTQRARRIQQTMDVYGVDRRTAQGLIDGIIETETDPVSGNTYLVNKIDGTARRLDYQDSSQTQSVNEQVASQIGDENTLWNSTEGVPGAEGAITEAYQRTIGQIPGMEGGEETQETVQNRQLFRLAQGDLIRSLSINPRFPVAEMQRIQRETDIEPSIFDSRDALKDRMRQLDRYLRNRLKNERRAAQNRDLPVETQQNAAAAAKDIANFLEILGVPRKGQEGGRQNNGQQQMRGPVGERRQNRQDGQQQDENDYALPVGHVEDGYRYQGGDPGNPDNWKKIEGNR